MKKKSVVLCELCEEDRLAATVVHWGLCTDHVTGISTNGASKPASNGLKRLHKKCGREIDPRGWRKHVAACKGKVA